MGKFFCNSCETLYSDDDMTACLCDGCNDKICHECYDKLHQNGKYYILCKECLTENLKEDNSMKNYLDCGILIKESMVRIQEASKK